MERKWFLKNLCDNTEIEVNKPTFKVGRHLLQDLVCYKVTVSREHAVLTVESGDLFVQAYKTLNGTWVNGRKLGDFEKLKLCEDDLIGFGIGDHSECCVNDNHYYFRVSFLNMNKENSKLPTTSTGKNLFLFDAPSVCALDLFNILANVNVIKEEPVNDEQIAETDEFAKRDQLAQNDQHAHNNQGIEMVAINKIKTEAEQEKPPVIEYSMEDEVIIIEDDDDFEWTSSQAFDRSLSDINIKSEELDRDVCIDISDSESEIDLVEALRNVCPDEEITENTSESTGRFLNDFDKNRDSHDNHLEIEENVVVAEENDLEIGNHQMNGEKNIEIEKNVIEVELDQELTVNKMTSLVDRSFLFKSKYHKPDIIEPHYIPKQPKKPQDRKRRKSLSKEPKYAKKKKVEEIPVCKNVDAEKNETANVSEHDKKTSQTKKLEKTSKPVTKTINTVVTSNKNVDKPSEMNHTINNITLNIREKVKSLTKMLPGTEETTSKENGDISKLNGTLKLLEDIPKKRRRVSRVGSKVPTINATIPKDETIAKENGRIPKTDKKISKTPKTIQKVSKINEKNQTSNAVVENQNKKHNQTCIKNKISLNQASSNRKNTSDAIGNCIDNTKHNENYTKPQRDGGRIFNRVEGKQSPNRVLNEHSKILQISHLSPLSSLGANNPKAIGNGIDNIKGNEYYSKNHVKSLQAAGGDICNNVEEEQSRNIAFDVTNSKCPSFRSISTTLSNSHPAQPSTSSRNPKDPRLVRRITAQEAEPAEPGQHKNRYNCKRNCPKTITNPNLLNYNSNNYHGDSSSPNCNNLNSYCSPTGYKNSRVQSSNNDVATRSQMETELNSNLTYNRSSTQLDGTVEYPVLEAPSRYVIFSLIGWNTKWLSEQKTFDAPPPIIRPDTVKMCISYSSHTNYCNVVTPFVVLEMWDAMSREFNNTRNKRFRTIIMDVRKFRNFQIARCIVYTTHDQNKTRDYPKEGDVILINVGLRGNYSDKKWGLKRLFGFVIFSKKSKMRTQEPIYKDLISGIEEHQLSAQLDIHVVLKPFEEEILTHKFVDSVIIGSVKPLLREYDAVVNLSKSPLCNIILNPQKKDFIINENRPLQFNFKKTLSASQKRAILDACHMCLGDKPGLKLIQGPPGTGKTTVIQEIIHVLITNNPSVRILVVTPSNASIDDIVGKLGNDIPKIKMVRIGIPEAVSREVKGYHIDKLTMRQTISDLLRERPEVRMDYENLINRKNILRETIQRQLESRKNVRELESNLKELEKKIDNFAGDYFTEYKYLRILNRNRYNLMIKSNVVCTTLSSCVRLNEFKRPNFIDCCIIDEASQSKETETLIPLTLGIKKVVLVGDPQQLPAVTMSKFARNLEYGQSLFSRIKKAFLYEKDNPVTLLRTQYRMHPDICAYPNDTFYNGSLKSAPCCSERCDLSRIAPYYVLNLDIENKNNNVDSYENLEEVECVVKLLEALYSILGQCSGPTYSVGVITPYNAQKHLLSKRIHKSMYNKFEIVVNTVDSFQGSEKDIMIMSCVRIRPNSFLCDEQRLNVALTRARRALYVIGTHPLFNTSSILQRLKLNAESRNLYGNIKELNVIILKSLIEKH